MHSGAYRVRPHPDSPPPLAADRLPPPLRLLARAPTRRRRSGTRRSSCCGSAGDSTRRPTSSRGHLRLQQDMGLFSAAETSAMRSLHKRNTRRIWNLARKKKQENCFVLGPGAVRCAGCHQHPPATVATTKAREKPKGARKLRAADVALNHRLVSWRVGGGTEDGPAATGEYNYRGASTSAVLAHLAGGNNWHAEDKEEDDADLVAAALRGISDLYDLIVSLQAARGGQEDDAHGTATAADTDEIEEHDAEITDDVDEDEEEEDDGICVVRGITSALEFSDGEEDWIVV
ncbi:uncharacterized protein LOC123428922 [Hordeum vulgare subsp. vulgare]|uniref:uncharacterized protein LOC123428922 n=1 Tax=Hordeum vulgare subsp. vulgare TaxID=112509 RepID=UPI001D1A41E5|nr:uncharacterized protein LOC123428922 [Hordeum vulgare subsp. vulgare]